MGTKSAPDRPEVRTIADLIGMLLGAADACGLAVVESTVDHCGFTLALPSGRVRIRLDYGPRVALTTADPVPSDQFPVVEHDDGLCSCRPGLRGALA
jgi:hypothetical protein